MDRFMHGGDIYSNQGVSLDFSVNTNPLGMPDKVRNALISGVDSFSRYPDTMCRDLIAAISAYENVPEEFILCGNGAADLIYRLCFTIKPKHALIVSPTFSEYEKALLQTGCEVSKYALSESNSFAVTTETIDKIIPGVDMLFLCSPNNPTGMLIEPDVIDKILLQASENNMKVVIDECFLDFTDGISSKRHLYDNTGLIILKAFTKMYAIAGIRLGYLLTGNTELLEKVRDAAQCWSVSVPAQIAGVAALSCTGWQSKTRQLIRAEREYLANELVKLGITVYPSDANFLLLRSEKPLYLPLLERGIMIRQCENYDGLDNSYYRIGIKTHSENMCLVNALEEIIHG